MSWLSDRWEDAKGVVDEVGDFVTDTAESGAEMVGQVIDAGIDGAARTARNLGADTIADTLTDLGDRVADITGGAIDELELGQTGDPRDLVRGDAAAINEATTVLNELASSIAGVGDSLATIDAAGWTGSAADAFNAVYDQQPRLWGDAAEAMTAAANSLTTWGHAVEAAQRRAADAIALWKEAELAEAAAGDDATDTWSEAKVAATEILRGARAERDGIAGQIVSQLSGATEMAPTEPPFTDRMFANATDLYGMEEMARINFTSGLVTSVTGIVGFVRQVNPTDSYNLSHPAEYAESMSELASGLVIAASDPGAVVEAMLTDFRENPFEAMGSLTGDALLTLATGGAGSAGFVARTTEDIVDVADGLGDAARLADRLPDGHHPDVPDSPAPTTHDAPVPEPADVPNSTADHDTSPTSADAGSPDTDVRHDPAPTPSQLADADGGAHQSATDSGVEADRTGHQNTEGGDPVDVATGEFLLPETDLALPGVLPLRLGRRHRSNYRFGRWFGPSWSATLDLRVVVEEAGVTFLAEDGVMLTYPHPKVDAEVVPTSGQRWPLTRTDTGGYRVHDPDRRITWHFAPKVELGGVDVALGNMSISAITDRHRNRIVFHHDSNGAPREIVHSGGYRVLVTAAEGRVTSLSVVDGDEAVQVRRFGYTHGDLTSVTTGEGGVTRFEYDTDGRMLAWVDDNGTRMDNTYDADGRVVLQRGTAGIMNCRFDYTDLPTGRITVVTDSSGSTTTHGFDSDLRLRDLIDPVGGHTHTDYNSRREPLRVRTPDGAVTGYSYTPDGDVARITRPDGATVAVDYAAPKQPAAVHHPDGAATRQYWDERGRLVAVTDPIGARTSYGHHDTGAIARVTDPTGATTLVDCDAAGLPIAVTDPSGAVTRIDRDGFGRPVRVTDPTGAVTTRRWSPSGRLIEATDADGATETWSHDGEGNLLTHTDAVGGVTAYTYGSFDLLSARTDPDGTTTTYTWDTERRLTAVTNPLGDTWTYRYDSAGRLVSETDYTGATTTYTRDAMGRPATVTAAAGVTRAHSYDLLGRLTEVRADTGEFRRFAHDVAGRITVAESGLLDDVAHTVELDYTAAGLASSETVDGRRSGFEYDLAGRRTRRSSASGGDTTWRWDPAGRLSTLITDGRTVAFTHDPRGMASGWQLGEIAVAQSRTPSGRLAARTVTAHPVKSLNFGFDSGAGAVTSVLREDAYEYRADGYLTRHSTVANDGHLNTEYALDPAGRITTVTRGDGQGERYGYDALGNITQVDDGRREYSGNLITSDGRTRYHHDAAGRLVRKVVTRISRKPDVWHYRYDAFDQLVEVVTPDGQRWAYTYDAYGRRTTKSKVADNGRVTERTRFTWDGARLVEQDAAGDVTRWTYQPGGFTPLTQSRVDAEFFAIVTDLVGSPVELVDPDAGTVRGSASADLWGRATWQGESTPLRFPGQYCDDETGLHYNLHRYYDPALGRYTSQDPLGLAPAANPSAYPHNPTEWIDPLGLTPEACGLPASSASTLDRLNEELFEKQLYGTVLDDGRLHPDKLESPISIIPGQSINNPEFKRLVEMRGEDVREWAKYRTESIPWQHGKAEVHFYMNERTKEVMYELDYKSRISWSK
ncbi:putative T7SS-secreted protein [Rhodococcus gannanensis]|uniref:T7SS-secreted protein n=1 Tax=Rhodococcus gannanensis TaxID=1960308 RepID=A0ABW4P0A0_9NOCA